MKMSKDGITIFSLDNVWNSTLVDAMEIITTLPQKKNANFNAKVTA